MERALVIIKPDGIAKGLVGAILDKFAQTNLQLIAVKLSVATREMAEKHYAHIKGTEFFDNVIAYFLGQFHDNNKIFIIVYEGPGAIEKCRRVAGATNPEEADPQSIRGAFGRITTRGVYENVVHVSSDKREAEREIRLWLKPIDLILNSSKRKSSRKKK